MTRTQALWIACNVLRPAPKAPLQLSSWFRDGGLDASQRLGVAGVTDNTGAGKQLD